MRSGASRKCVPKQSLSTRKSTAKIRMTPVELPLTIPRGTMFEWNLVKMRNQETGISAV
jgi:hypothetical protein